MVGGCATWSLTLSPLDLRSIPTCLPLPILFSCPSFSARICLIFDPAAIRYLNRPLYVNHRRTPWHNGRAKDKKPHGTIGPTAIRHNGLVRMKCPAGIRAKCMALLDKHLKHPEWAFSSLGIHSLSSLPNAATVIYSQLALSLPYCAVVDTPPSSSPDRSFDLWPIVGRLDESVAGFLVRIQHPVSHNIFSFFLSH